MARSLRTQDLNRVLRKRSVMGPSEKSAGAGHFVAAVSRGRGRCGRRCPPPCGRRPDGSRPLERRILQIVVCKAASRMIALSSGAEVPITMNGDGDWPASIGMRVNVMRPADVVEDPAPPSQQLAQSPSRDRLHSRVA